MHADESGHRPLLALLTRLCAIAVLTTMSALIKYASDEGIHLAEILFWRQLITIPIVLAWTRIATGGFSVLSTRRPKAHLRRAAYGMAGMVLRFGSLTVLPLAEATTLGFTAPIFAVILAMLLLREDVGIWRWSAVVLGFAGVIIIAQPGGGSLPATGALLALGGAFMVALISIQIADLNRTESPLTIVFWFAVCSMPVFALALPFYASSHSPREWLLLVAIGVLGTLGQLLLTTALRFGKVASVIVMDYSSLFWAALYGWLIWRVLPADSTWLGAPLVIAAGLVITWRERKLARRRLEDQHVTSGT